MMRTANMTGEARPMGRLSRLGRRQYLRRTRWRPAGADGPLVLIVWLLLLGFALEISGCNSGIHCPVCKNEILFVFAVTSTQTMIPASLENVQRLAARKWSGW
jgi:hypothetical protein